ncbi:hypothetical protein [Streptomyces sp. NPDC004629]|uniref:hypothetical protein n=1 Tax=Streptomyces sp. NPDC004629 TaxID=3364705 RepID=UPI00368C4D53
MYRYAAPPRWGSPTSVTARVGLPGDVASAAVFLMTDGYATGSVVDVDGCVQLT